MKITNKKIIIIIAVILVAIIPISFLYSLIVLLIQPSKSFVVENGKIYNGEPVVRIYIKRGTSSKRWEL